MQLCASVSPLRTESRGAAEHVPCITGITAPGSRGLKAAKHLHRHPQGLSAPVASPGGEPPAVPLPSLGVGAARFSHLELPPQRKTSYILLSRHTKRGSILRLSCRHPSPACPCTACPCSRGGCRCGTLQRRVSLPPSASGLARFGFLPQISMRSPVPESLCSQGAARLHARHSSAPGDPETLRLRGTPRPCHGTPCPRCPPSP